MERIEAVKTTCLRNWCAKGELDSRLMDFEANFEKWLLQIPEKNRSTVITLVENLEYYSHRTTNMWLRNLHKQLTENTKITDENTIYVFIKSKYGKTNSSNDYWTEYKAINNINKNICIEDMDAMEDDDWLHIDNIIFIDDFSGTGKSFTNELEKNTRRYENKNVYFITINIMTVAIENIQKYCSENNINITLLSAFKHEKVFNCDIFDNNEKAKAEITSVSKELKIPKNEILGYHKSQALIAFYNNTPNNTLGIIRYNTQTYISLFPRKDDKVPGWLEMKKKRMLRKTANYNNKMGDG